MSEALCEGAGPPTWFDSVDPMLDELAASLVASRPAVTPAPGCLHVVDTTSLVTASQCTTDPPLSSPVQGMPPQMGQLVVVGAVAPGDDGEVWPPGFEPAKHVAGTSTPRQDGQPDSQATPDPSDATTTPR
jgi:hypothetical protein